MPQAAAPIAFALVALPITGAAESGAAMVFAMTAAQVLGAVPVSRLGRRFNAVRYLRALIAVRTAAFAAVTVLAAREAPFALLIAAVIAAEPSTAPRTAISAFCSTTWWSRPGFRARWAWPRR
ncbi:hypothetical protein ACFQXA_02035 [Nocardiopsis composta]